MPEGLVAFVYIIPGHDGLSDLNWADPG